MKNQTYNQASMNLPALPACLVAMGFGELLVCNVLLLVCVCSWPQLRIVPWMDLLLRVVVVVVVLVLVVVVAVVLVGLNAEAKKSLRLRRGRWASRRTTNTMESN